MKPGIWPSIGPLLLVVGLGLLAWTLIGLAIWEWLR